MVQARRLGHVTLTTPDIGRLADYFTRVIGLSLVDRKASNAVLATKLGQEAVILEHGHLSHCKRLALQVAPSIGLDDMARHLSAKGIRSEKRSDVTPGVSQSLAIEDPMGNVIDLFAGYTFASDDELQIGIMPQKLGHIAFQAIDVQKIVKFYVDILGFRVSDWRGDFFAFLRCSPDHHTINFVKGEMNQVHHVAFELRDWAEMQRACDFLAKKDIRLVLGPIRHIIGHNIASYHKNSDNMLIELFTELDQMKDEELGYFDPRPWHQDRPQRPKVWDLHLATNYWGPGRLVSRDE